MILTILSRLLLCTDPNTLFGFRNSPWWWCIVRVLCSVDCHCSSAHEDSGYTAMVTVMHCVETHSGGEVGLL